MTHQVDNTPPSDAAPTPQAPTAPHNVVVPFPEQYAGQYTEQPPTPPLPDEDPYLTHLDQQPPTQTSPTRLDPTAPHNPDAERAVLGALLTAPDRLTDIRPLLNPSDFHHPVHEELYALLLDFADHDTPIDPLTINDHLVRTGTLTTPAWRNVGGSPYLIQLQQACPITANAPAYAESVRDYARLRRAATAATNVLQLVRTADPSTLHQALLDSIDTLDATYRADTPDQTTTSTWAPLALDDVLAGQEIDPPPSLLARADGVFLLYKGAVHTVSGEPGSGKTWLTLIAALQELAHGNTVTMIDFEDRASRVIGRLLALGAHPDAIRHRFRYIRPHTGIDPTTMADLDQGIHGANLVILDGVTEAMTLHGFELEKNADVARFYDLLPRHIADTTGAAVVLIDHVVKDGEKQGRWALGGQHKLAGIDGVAYLVKAIEPFGRGKTGVARITVSKDRPGYVEEIALGRTVAELHLDAREITCLRHRLQEPSETPKDEAGNMRPTHLMERVSRWLEGNPRANRSRITESVTGKTTYVRRALDRLIQEGYVEVSQEGNREQIHRVITPFREDQDGALA